MAVGRGVGHAGRAGGGTLGESITVIVTKDNILMASHMMGYLQCPLLHRLVMRDYGVCVTYCDVAAWLFLRLEQINE